MLLVILFKEGANGTWIAIQQRGGGGARADIVIWESNQAKNE